MPSVVPNLRKFPIGHVTLAVILGALFLFLSNVKAQTLYDPTQGTLPQSQGWSLGVLGAATDFVTNSAALLDTTASLSTYAGWTEIAPDLNRTNGFTLRFSARLDAENHSNTNRAGFSLIVLCDDAHGVELGFWGNTIFAQNDNPLFFQGENVAFTTSNSFVSYALTFHPTNYVLSANGAAILTGPVHNYTSYNGPLNVYSTPNFLFMGDDTTSASGREEIGNVTLITAPKLAIQRGGIISWTGVSNQTYQVLVSTNLTSWNNAASITSPSNTFSYTNNTATVAQFFRIVVP